MDSSNDFAVGYAVGDNAANRNCGYGNGMFGADGGFFWIFALLLLPMMTNGGLWGNNGRGQAVTEAGLCNAMNFNNLENAVGRLSDQQSAIARQTDNAICNLGYETLRNFNSLEQQLAACCCGIEKAILENRYLAAQNTSAILQGQKDSTREIIDWLCGQENRNLRDENMRNFISSQFCGVVRYPLQTTYSTDCNPFFGGGYGYGDGCRRCCGNGNI
ncbi:MAG: hypothetical protein HFH88_11130 [Lachnospiraceae bacterium]|jgi:hypothetical protein|nr:hypothetical protein [Lachnospiraceae bacterium]